MGFKDSELAAILRAFESAFREVSPIILQRAGKIDFSSKSDGSPVTEVDIEVENQIINLLKKSFPKIVILGEESGYDENNLPEDCWLLDPIDGTRSFIENKPVFTIMAVHIVDRAANAALVYNPSTNECYSAIKNTGSYKNGAKLNLSSTPLPSTAYAKPKFIPELNEILKELDISCIEPPHGAGFFFGQVAEGKIAARFSLRSKGFVHDYATGALLIEEAGGVLIPINEDHYTFKTKSFVACHPDLEDVIRANIEKLKDLENSRS